MKQVDEMPTDGQFVVIWKENGKLMSETRAWFRGDLLVLACVDCCFVFVDCERSICSSSGFSVVTYKRGATL